MTIEHSNFTKEYLVVAQNASGRNLKVPVYRFSNNNPGPTVYIQSSIHGAEVQGNVVLHHLFNFLASNAINGEIIMVPNCNPVGSNLKSGEYTLGRFDPVNGQNWNRAYYYDESTIRKFSEQLTGETILDTESIKKKYRSTLQASIEERLNNSWGLGLAESLNLKLQNLALSADIVLDLHNGPVSTRHIYVPEYAKESAQYFNIPHVILIPNIFAGALDEATFCPWWTLSDLIREKFPNVVIDFNVEAFTVEMGSQEVIDFKEGNDDAVSILTYLAYKGVIEDPSLTPISMSRKAVYLRDYKTLYSQFGGMVEYVTQPGKIVAEGDIMARILNVDDLENDKATSELLAPCDLIPILHFPSASVLSGTQLFKCFTKYFDL